MRAVWGIVLVAACGRVGFDQRDDAGIGDDTITDADCVLGPWGNITREPVINGNMDDYEPTLSPNGLVLVYTSYSVSPGLWAASRSVPSGPFGSQRMLTELSTAQVEHGAMWSPDGTLLYFTREGGVSQPMVATYLGNNTFSAPVNANLPEGASFWLSQDELEVFFTVDLAGNDPDMHHATRATKASAWQVDALVDGFNRVGEVDGFPAYDEPRGDLYFERGSASGIEIVVAHRTQRGQPFGAAVPVAELNAPGTNGDPELSADARTMLFGSDRAGGAGFVDIYVATRGCQ